jgi:predicted acyl esterase
MPEEQAFRVVDHTWIPMPDGVRLSARLWLPEKTPAPVVLEYIPYRKSDSYRAIDDIWGRVLASRGIAFARVDVRGSGDSEGVMTDEYSSEELSGGVACIAWLAAQPWSNGAVGMRGISWGGINALQIAALRPPALKAIMPMCCCDNRFTGDAHYIGGALGHTNFQWGTSFKLVMAGPPDPSIVGADWEAMWRARLEATPPILARWLAHQRYDEYWQRGSIATDYGAIACPVYVVGGLLDSYIDTVCQLLEKLWVPRKGLIGPWGHIYPHLAQPQALDWAQEEVRWWDHWLNGIETGIMDEPILRAYMPYATAAEYRSDPVPGRWIAEERWPAPAIGRRNLHLNSGTLSVEADAEKAIHFTGDKVVGTTKPEWLDRLPVEQSRDDARSLLFDSGVLEEDVEILGPPIAHIRLSADKPVAKIAVRLCDVAPDGRSWLVSYALRNLTHRDSNSEPRALVPGTRYDMALPLYFTAHRFAKGHRIRLAISENLWPLAWPSPEAVTLTIVTGFSTLELPVRKQENVPAPLPIAELRTAGRTTVAAVTTEPGADGRYAIHNDVSAYVANGPTGAVTRERREFSEISEGNMDCRWSQAASIAWQGAQLDCRLDASYELSSTPTTFLLTESLMAQQDGRIVFERRTEHEIPRDLL